MNTGLTQTCIAIAVPPPHIGTLPKAQRGRQGNAKLKVMNKVFECLALLKIKVIEYGKMGFKWLEVHSQRQRFLKKKSVGGSPGPPPMRGAVNPPPPPPHTLCAARFKPSTFSTPPPPP